MAHDHQRSQSILAGASFIVLAHDPTKGIASLGGYAGFGAFFPIG
jgi:hypothetical protein